MKYYSSDFVTEYLRLFQTPKSKRETYNKLTCLMRLEEQRNPNANRIYVQKPSKRRNRLLKMYYAFQG